MTKKTQSARGIPTTAKSENTTGIEVLTAKQEENISPFSIFTSEEFGKLRASTINGEVYFGASDVAKALGYRNITDAIKRHCARVVKRDGCKVVANQHSKSVAKTVKTQMNYIPLSDVLRLVVNSKLPAAKAYERWVFEEVLPSINRNGVYEAQGHRAAAAAEAASRPPAIDMKALEAIVSPMIEMLRVMNRRLDIIEERLDRQAATTVKIRQRPQQAQLPPVRPSPDYYMSFPAKDCLDKLYRLGIEYNGGNWLRNFYRDLSRLGFVYKDTLGYHATSHAESSGFVVNEIMTTFHYGGNSLDKCRVRLTDAGLWAFNRAIRDERTRSGKAEELA